MIPDLPMLLRRINYEFNDASYLNNALTHRSVGAVNNERLEFLGDSILSFIIAQVLFERFPYASEGDLSRLRSHLVKGERLSEIALEIDLGNCIKLGAGERRSGGHQRQSILADALEALFAAVYLDGGMDAITQVVLALYQSRLDEKQLFSQLKDPKTQLQEQLQANKIALPLYQLDTISGLEHEQVFTVVCVIAELKITVKGEGSNRRRAEQAAAEKALLYLEKVKDTLIQKSGKKKHKKKK